MCYVYDGLPARRRRRRSRFVLLNPFKMLDRFLQNLLYIFLPESRGVDLDSSVLQAPTERFSGSSPPTQSEVHMANCRPQDINITNERKSARETPNFDELLLLNISGTLKLITLAAKSAFSTCGPLAVVFFVLWRRLLTEIMLYPLFRLLFGTLYPAYASYKAVKTKNVKEYVKWMMYWIVFALFTCAETFTDVFLSWFPFYYEIKIILVIWLLSPATKGSSILYRKFVHPMLSSREQEIDDYISKAKEQSYKQVLEIGSKGMNALMQTALKSGGGLVNQIRKSYSLSDLSEQRHDRDYESTEETDSLLETRVIRRQKHSPRRNSPRRHTTSAAMYFSEIDVRHDALATIQSVEDISSGYSSGEVLHPGQPPKLHAREGLVRTASIGGSTKARPTRVTRSSTVLKKSDSDDEERPLVYLNDQARFLRDFQPPERSESTSSSSDAEFRDCIEPEGNVTHGLVQKPDPILPVTLSENPIEELSKIPEQKDQSTRGGKYRKMTAPPPPPSPSKQSTAAIKATLVLTPGVVKSLGSQELKTDVFCHSPKTKRRSLNPSPDSRKSSKLDALKKKMHFWHRDDTELKPSKSIWYDDKMEKSKSEEDFRKLKFRQKLLEKIRVLKED